MSMFKLVFLFPFLYFLNAAVCAQNSLPLIDNVRAKFNSKKKQLVLLYNVMDKEETKVEVSVRLIDKAGVTIPLEAKNCTGDIGASVATGKGKRITCTCEADIARDMENYSVELTADDLFKTDIGAIIAQVDSNRISQSIAYISGPRYFATDGEHLDSIRNYIDDQFRQNKLQASRNGFTHENYNATNLVGSLAGKNNGNSIFILNAHYDAVENSPGADDNASGVAAILEVARVMSQYSFQRTIRFVAFDLEEEGFIGSSKLLSNSDSMKHEKIEGAFNYDMLGFYSEKPNSQPFPEELKEIFPDAYNQIESDGFRGNFILVTANNDSQDLGAKYVSCADKYVPELKKVFLTVPEDGNFAPEAFRASDHVSFWNKGIKAVSIGDTGNVRNYNYHSETDTTATLNMTFISKVVKATVATLAELARVTHSHSVSASIKCS